MEFRFSVKKLGDASGFSYFTGKELDSTGLYYYGARYYNARVGRFITADNFVAQPYNPQYLNRYSYCMNNPLRYIDPTGNTPQDNWWSNIDDFSISGINFHIDPISISNSVNVIIHGIDLTQSDPYKQGYSGDLGKILGEYGATVKELFWSGRITDALQFDKWNSVASGILAAYELAKYEGKSFNVIAHSWGSPMAGAIITSNGNLTVDNFITLGSPYVQISGKKQNLSNIASVFDPFSVPSAISGIFYGGPSTSHNYLFYGFLKHNSYWNNPEVIKLIYCH